jgi:endonuclease/exonuclease/phosphatase family metal-dependent hydrolase
MSHGRALIAVAALVVAATGSTSRAAAPGLKLATWNLEWLLTPETFDALKDHCSNDDTERRATRRQLPCDVVRNIERGGSDFAALRRYAERLDADVIALEEVDGPNAARQLFRRHEFCFTGSVAVQNNGFAIRRGIPFRCEADVRGLSLGDSVRRGAVVVLYPGTAREIHLLGVHLKSGCARQPLTGTLQACRLLARQLPALEAWIEAQARAGHRFGVLGDFNRDLLGELPTATRRPQPGVLAELNDGDPPGSTLFSAAGRGDFRNCAQGQRHSGFIDYILLSEPLFLRRVPGSVERLVWTPEDAAHRILSDHCPVAVRIEP